MSTIIRANSLNKIYKMGGEDFYALNNVNVEVKKGRLVILKGRSGSGKTTLLNMLSTLDSPTSGEVFFEDENVTSAREEVRDQLRRTRMGIVFQSIALVPIMNAYENVEFALRLSGLEGDRRERVHEALELVKIAERSGHMPGQMSGGEQQRVAIARAIVHKPLVLFADEPTSALDVANSRSVMHIFRELIKREGISVVMTTHDPGLMEMGDDIYELQDGVVINEIHRE